MLSSKDRNIVIPHEQLKPESGNRCKICHTMTNITCINCSVGVCVEHWNKHASEVHMKGISLRNIMKVTSVYDALDLKTCLRYMFNKL
jgi:hypothetical protein